MKNNFIVLDVETGGLDYKKNPITQIALSVIEPKKMTVIYQYETFVKPYNDMEITKKALEASRVTIEEINKGIDHVKLMAKLIEIFREYSIPHVYDGKPILVGHNFTFDIEFLDFLFGLRNKKIFDYVDRVFYCTMRLMKMSERNAKVDMAYTLTACCERFGIKLKAAHGAMPDVNATAKLFTAILAKLDSKASKTVIIDNEEQQKSRKFFELP